VEEVIALVSDHSVARAAFVEAIRRRPGKIITLRLLLPRLPRVSRMAANWHRADTITLKPEDAQLLEDAHRKSVSTFANDEHLRLT
jgi:hypothetical protein